MLSRTHNDINEMCWPIVEWVLVYVVMVWGGYCLCGYELYIFDRLRLGCWFIKERRYYVFRLELSKLAFFLLGELVLSVYLETFTNKHYISLWLEMEWVIYQSYLRLTNWLLAENYFDLNRLYWVSAFSNRG